jgi:hypothetical protein
MRFPIILLLILVSPLFGADNFPPEIAALKATYDKDVEALRMQYEQALIKRSDVERVKLHDAEVKFTKAGNLDGALAARKLTEALPMFTVPESMKDVAKRNDSSVIAIEKASWGVGERTKDVALVLSPIMARRGKITITNTTLGDPAPNYIKSLELVLVRGSNKVSKIFADGDVLDFDSLLPR